MYNFSAIKYFRENSRRLVLENDGLHTQMHQTEKNTIDVVTYLKRLDLEKDKQVSEGFVCLSITVCVSVTRYNIDFARPHMIKTLNMV